MDKRSLLFVLTLTVGLFFVNHWFNLKESERKATQVATPVEQVSPALPPPAPVSHPEKENLYVLENEFQQVVFSTIGGAISEINLPFPSSIDKDSLVLPISFDRIMEKKYPYNDRFPIKSYSKWEDGHVRKEEQTTLGGYYPLLRRNVIGENDRLLYLMSSQNYAFQVLSDFEPYSAPVYKLSRFEKNLIEFQHADDRRKITKTYTLNPNTPPYCLEVSVTVDGDARGLWLTTGIPEVELVSNNFSPVLKYLIYKGQKCQIENLSLPKASTTYSSIQPTWISNSSGFLGLIIQPISNTALTGFKSNLVSGAQAPTRLSLVDAQYDLYPRDKYPGYEYLVPLSNYQGSTTFRLFAGPYQNDLLQTIDSQIAKTESNPKFTLARSFQGWFTFISEPFAKFLFILMKFFHFISGSWGFSIILLTVALRVMLYPLNQWSIKSSLKMQEISPLTSAIQEKHKKDPKRAQMETVALYREKGVNPLTGCFPILIQIPFLIGMFDLLKSTFELRGVSFIPGWINNLTEPDVLFSWNYPLFFVGTSLHILPLLLGGIMFLQQKMTSPVKKNGATLTDQQKQQRTMGYIMVVVFAVMSYNFPSGLNIYWLSSMGLGIVQQWITSKKMKPSVIIKTK